MDYKYFVTEFGSNGRVLDIQDIPKPDFDKYGLDILNDYDLSKHEKERKVLSISRYRRKKGKMIQQCIEVFHF